MKPSHAFILLSAVPAIAAPALKPRQDGPPGASGSLRGSAALLGFDSLNNIPTTPSTVIPPDEFEVAPGQSENPNLGLYVDLSTVKNPQPLQGSLTAPTDPGPR